ncbi:unnamed protein product [Rhodiola kirilowii]
MGKEAEDGEKVEQVLCMNGGESETSYAKNSNLQRAVMFSARHILKESVIDVFNIFSSSKCLAVADLGCGTGPNALLAVSNIVNIVCRTRDDMGHKSPNSFLLFLNDLPSNDFNTIFKSLAGFNGFFRRDQCFVMAVPGSFHGRLFPCKSLNFVHSSYCLHWLSQVPKGLVDENGEALDKTTICLAETSSLAVQKAYAEQFGEDFHAFLKSRSEELRPGGSMVLTFLGSARSNAPFKVFEVINQTLGEMGEEDLIKESKLDTFKLPFHAASCDQVSEVIINEGSFNIRKLEAFKISWDTGMDESVLYNKGKAGGGEFVAKSLRAVLEPLLVAAFGEVVMDELFGRVAVKFEELMNIAGDCYYHNIIVWLTKNASMMELPSSND